MTQFHIFRFWYLFTIILAGIKATILFLPSKDIFMSEDWLLMLLLNLDFDLSS